MDQLPFDTPKRGRGGDTRTPQAKADIAKRENQIVELRLRNISFAAIGRAVGVSKTAAINAFKKALHRNTDQDIQTHHRIELAKLEMEETRLWQALDSHKESWQATATCIGGLNRIHVRRAHLLGLDAPTKVDVSGIYQRGGTDFEAEQSAREAVIEALPIEERRRIYELFYQAGLRAAAGDFSQPAIDTTVSNGSDSRTTSDDGTESDPQ
jgi:hypothetical protein